MQPYVGVTQSNLLSYLAVTTALALQYFGFFYWIEMFPKQVLWAFMCLLSTSLLKTLSEKGEIAHKEQFLLLPWCFQPV